MPAARRSATAFVLGDRSGAPSRSVAEVQLCESKGSERGAYDGSTGYHPGPERQDPAAGMPQCNGCCRQREGEAINGDTKAGEGPRGQRSGTKPPSRLGIDRQGEAADQQC